MKSLIAILTVAFLGLGTPALSAKIGDDGLHKQPWFSTTFRDIAEDIETAEAEGKRLVMIFEQRGCIYCERLHETVLSDPEVATYIQEHFMVVQYNMFGDEEVIDLDGRELTEKTAARAWSVVFTPTIMFLPESVPDGMTTDKAAVATMPGAFGKWTSLHMFQWVVEKGYETDEHFQKYHARKLEEARASGALVE
ncbi:MAG: thioredoxin family protein [Alphaproteobacteria bacterium]